MMKKVRVRWILLALLLVFVWLTMAFPVLGEGYARVIYPFLSTLLSRLSAVFSFSIGDCFIYGSMVGLLFYLVYTGVKRRPIKRALWHVAEYLVWVYAWFYLSWGINYFRTDFFTRAQIPYVTYSSESFHTFLTAYTDSLNASWLSVEKVDTAWVSSEVKQGYRDIAGRFGMKPPAGYLHPKPMLLPSLMSGVGVLGYMGPFFNEYNLNPDLLPVQYPFTYAHEMAHALGIASEAEANLYAFLICSGSATAEIRFSGYFSLLPYVMSNAYTLLGEEAFRKWTATLRPEVKELYNQKVAYWQAKYSPLIGKLQDTAYNLFLKGNNIQSGTENYSEVIGLLMAYEAALRVCR